MMNKNYFPGRYVMPAFYCGLLDSAIANASSVCLSVCHTHEPCLNDSRYWNTLAPYDRAMLIVSQCQFGGLVVHPRATVLTTGIPCRKHKLDQQYAKNCDITMWCYNIALTYAITDKWTNRKNILKQNASSSYLPVKALIFTLLISAQIILHTTELNPDSFSVTHDWQ